MLHIIVYLHIYAKSVAVIACWFESSLHNYENENHLVQEFKLFSSELRPEHEKLADPERLKFLNRLYLTPRSAKRCQEHQQFKCPAHLASLLYRQAFCYFYQHLQENVFSTQSCHH